LEDIDKCPCIDCISFPICNSKKSPIKNGGTVLVISYLQKCSLLMEYLNAPRDIVFTERVQELKRIYKYE